MSLDILTGVGGQNWALGQMETILDIRTMCGLLRGTEPLRSSVIYPLSVTIGHRVGICRIRSSQVSSGDV